MGPVRNNLLNSEIHGLLVRYLLGELSPPERERLEEEYFIQEDTWEALAATENDLIDSYVKGQLPDRERRQFEEYFLRSPRRQQRVEFARNLMDSGLRKGLATQIAPPVAAIEGLRRPARSPLSRVRLQLLASAAALIIVAFLVWQNYRLRVQVGQLQSQQRQASNSLPGQQAAIASPAGKQQTQIISVALSPGLLRDSGSSNALAAVRIDSTSSVVLLVLNLERDKHSQYDLVLQTAEGRVIERINGISSKPDASGLRNIALAVPSDLLATGDYIVRITVPGGSHSEVVDSYAFSIIR
jgi:anti-sigma factor RsiW